MARNPIARHVNVNRHQVVQDKRRAREVARLMKESTDAMTEMPWKDGEGHFDPTKSDGTNYD